MPASFSFTNAQDVEVSAITTSDSVILTGYDSAPISIVNGAYSIDGGSYTTDVGTVIAGQTLTLQASSSADYSTASDVVVTVGGVAATYSITTRDAVISPADFEFTAVNGVELYSVNESNSITVANIEIPVAISIAGGEYQIDSGDYTSAAGTVTAGQSVIVKVTAAADYATAASATLSIGNKSAAYAVRTRIIDSVPASFSFTNAQDVEVSTLTTSNSLTLADFDSAPISIVNGAYSIDGGSFSTDPGTIIAGQTLTLQAPSSADYNTATDVVVTVGGVDATFTITTRDAVVTPADFEFTAVTGVEVNSINESNSITVANIEIPVAISIAGGEYKIDSGDYSSIPGTVTAGQSVTVKVTAAADFETAASATLTIGNKSAAYAVTTRVIDTVPASFSFTNAQDVEVNTLTTSNSLTLADFDSAPISIVNGAYSIDGGSFSTDAGTIVAGQTLTLQAPSSADYSTATDVVVTVGGVAATYTITTRNAVVTPADFEFTAVSGVELNSVNESNSITVANIEIPVAISIAGGEYKIDNGDFTSAAGTVTAGQSVTVRVTAAADFETAASATLSIGDQSAAFTATTRAKDTTPDTFSFTEQTDVQANSWVESNTVTLSGYDGSVELSISNGEYSINGGAYATDATMALAGSELTVRQRAAATLATITETVVNLGDVSAVFSSTTQATNSPPTWSQMAQQVSPNVISATADGASDVTSVDLDGDGDLDVLSASWADDTIAWYENDGSAGFTEHTITTAADGALSVAVGDVDGDGDLDMLSASTYDATIAWYENDGSAGFTEHTITTAADGAYSVAVADVDGDGDLDVLSASSQDDTIAWYENDGSAGFTEHAITTAADGARSVAVGDVDGDGDLDVLSASYYDDTIAWYENDGSVGFTEHTITTAADGAWSVEVGDVDGDGDLDVLSASRDDDTIAWYENDGSAGFTEHTITTAADSARSVAVADVDGDGDLDVLSASYSDDTIAWYENDGSTGFTEHTITTAADGAYSVAVADVDGDGYLDVLSASWRDNTIAWYPIWDRQYWAATGIATVFDESASDADGNALTYSINDAISHAADASYFSIDPASGELTFSGAPATNSPADHNGDNIYEVWIAVSDGYSVLHRAIAVRAYDDDEDDDNDGIADSDDAFPIDPTESLDTDGDGIGNNTDSDDDGDGTADTQDNSPLDAANALAPVWSQIAQQASPNVISDTADGAYDVTSVDLDGDGDLDVLSASYNDDTIAWYENDGSAGFTEHTITTAADGASSVAVADVDGDGDLDVLSASYNDDTIAWYENDGSAGFTEHTISTAADGAYSVAVGDVDGDGDLDVLSASAKDDTIAWYENDGSAAFIEHTITTATDYAYSIAVGDVDGDGDLDVLSASFSDDTIAWYENDGSTGFTEHTITTAADGAKSVAVGDVDGDGDLDVLSASADDDTIAWYENDGSAGFAEHTITTGALYASSVAVADVDGDGDLDVLSASRDDDTIAWYENDGSAGFTEHTITTAADSARSVAVADVDGDGDLDVLSASRDDDTIAWYPVWDRHYWVATGVATVFDESASDADGNALTYSINDDISHVLDASFFSIDGVTGELTFSGAPAVASPGDSDGDNIYEVWISVTDGYSVLNRAIAVRAYDDDDDDDDDGVADSEDAFPLDPAESLDTDGDGIGNNTDSDDDGDGTGDTRDNSPLDAANALAPVWSQSDQQFSPNVISDTAEGARHVTSVDLDGDGDMDVLSASYNDDTIAWYENDGSASFTEHTISATAAGASSVAVGDVDGDGDLDVLSASLNDDTIAWYENDGSAGFTEHTITTEADSARSVAVGDVDGDGDLDVLSAFRHDDTIAWFENDGSAGFAVHTITTGALYASSVAVADVDGDGDLDVLSSSYLDDTIAWYENDGSEGFTEHTITTAADAAYSVAVGDMNGDGDLDVLSASINDNTIAWYPVRDRQYQAVSVVATVFDESASDADGNTLTYSINDDISHVLDASFFSIDGVTGELTFNGAPAVASPGDTNGDNIYEVWISVSDGYSVLNRAIAVEVIE